MNYKQLTEVERHQIYSFLKAGYTQKAVAQELGKHPSMISRECRRNKGLKGYRPAQAQRLISVLNCQTRVGSPIRIWLSEWTPR